LLQCAKVAVSHPGKMFECAHGRVKMACDTKLDWLAVQIPSGRQIMFAKPRLKVVTTTDKHGNERTREELSALKSPGWYRRPLYGGYFANAITQGACRDILVNGMLDVEAAGFPIVMHIHDEIIAEVPDGSPLTLEQMTAIMVKERPWHAGLPLAAAGHVLKRYRKG
jgi:DNA polymerase